MSPISVKMVQPECGSNSVCHNCIFFSQLWKSKKVLRARQNAPVELHQTTSIPNPCQFLPSVAQQQTTRKTVSVPKFTLKQQNCNINFGIQLIRTQLSKLFEKIENNATWILKTWLTQGAIQNICNSIYLRADQFPDKAHHPISFFYWVIVHNIIASTRKELFHCFLLSQLSSLVSQRSKCDYQAGLLTKVRRHCFNVTDSRFLVV